MAGARFLVATALIAMAMAGDPWLVGPSNAQAPEVPAAEDSETVDSTMSSDAEAPEVPASHGPEPDESAPPSDEGGPVAGTTSVPLEGRPAPPNLQPTRVPSPTTTAPTLALEVTPNSAVLDSQLVVVVHVRSNDARYNTIRVVTGCGYNGTEWATQRTLINTLKATLFWEPDGCRAGPRAIRAEARTFDDPDWNRSVSASAQVNLRQPPGPQPDITELFWVQNSDNWPESQVRLAIEDVHYALSRLNSLYGWKPRAPFEALRIALASGRNSSGGELGLLLNTGLYSGPRAVARSTVLHEMTHTMQRHLWARSGANGELVWADPGCTGKPQCSGLPAWISEGHAVYEEVRGGGKSSCDVWIAAQGWQKQGRWIPLATWRTDIDLRSATPRQYDEGAALFLYLDTTKGSAKVRELVLAFDSTDFPGTFQRIVGQPLQGFESDLLQRLSGATPAPFGC